MAEDEEKLAQDKIDFGRTRANVEKRTDAEWSKATNTAFSAQQELRRVNDLAYEYERALAAVENYEDPAMWQAKQWKAPDKFRQESGNPRATMYDWLLATANGPGGMEFQKRHEDYLASRGTAADAEARVQEIIDRAAAGKKARGYEVG
ncbi:MAG: hypothetical protein IJ087_17190 [Eggerthellaceae bacterium]|nr:hypothetical protein [Eggerthellaceae bacterium]